MNILEIISSCSQTDNILSFRLRLKNCFDNFKAMVINFETKSPLKKSIILSFKDHRQMKNKLVNECINLEMKSPMCYL